MNIEYFLGKPCTIITSFTNFGQLDPSIVPKMFTGILISEDKNSLMLQELGGNNKSLFYKAFVIGIVEETVVGMDQIEIEPVSQNSTDEEFTLEYLDDLRKNLI